jgi:hypothetical protein
MAENPQVDSTAGWFVDESMPLSFPFSSSSFFYWKWKMWGNGVFIQQ